jgi:hypothetical protein
VRPAFHKWGAALNIRWDADQFTKSDVHNLLMRVGVQVGIGEVRPSSPNSTGMGWGLFEVVDQQSFEQLVAEIERGEDGAART